MSVIDKLKLAVLSEKPIKNVNFYRKDLFTEEKTIHFSPFLRLTRMVFRTENIYVTFNMKLF